MDEVTETSTYKSVEGHHPLFVHKRNNREEVHCSSYWPAAHGLFPGCSGPLCTWTDYNLKIQMRNMQTISQNHAGTNSTHKLQVPITFHAINFFKYFAFKLTPNRENLAIPLWAWKPCFWNKAPSNRIPTPSFQLQNSIYNLKLCNAMLYLLTLLSTVLLSPFLCLTITIFFCIFACFSCFYFQASLSLFSCNSSLSGL